MSVYKNNGKWDCQFYYVDFTGERKKKHKRGFDSKKEALEYERENLNHLEGSMDMTFASFTEVYRNNVSPRFKEKSMTNKMGAVNKHIIPYFGNKKMNEIKPADIIDWQNMLIVTNLYSDAYLRFLNNQLNAILNHADKLYGLKDNPCKKVTKIGSYDERSLKFWTYSEYVIFRDSFEKGTMHYLIFEILYWTGMRIGELLALTKDDIDIFAKVINVNKTYYRKDKRDIITSPKTKSSTRTITIPNFLLHEILEYYKQLFEYPDNERLFQIGVRAVENLMKRHIEKTGLPSIRVHDLRHSHCAYLINKGVEPVVIKERLGHKHIKITLDTYGHLYPNRQRDVADMLGS